MHGQPANPPSAPTGAAVLARPGPVLLPDALVLSLADPAHELDDVRVYQELRRPRDQPATWDDGVWRVVLPRPDRGPATVARMEYAFVVSTGGGTAFVTDPANPEWVDGPFGPKSVLRLPGYAEPGWVTATRPESDATDEAGAGTLTRTTVPVPRFHSGMAVHLWHPPGVEVGTRLPLLLVHDGPEYDRYAALTRLLAVCAADGRRPFRAALLAPLPGQRDATYSAAAAYADAMAFTVLPWLERAAPQPSGSRPVAMGASLGALAALHLAARHPNLLGGLVLQSGSYFRLRTDGHERGFSHFDRVSRFVGGLLRPTPTTRPLPIAMTCGAVEENLANNRVMATALRARGHDVSMVVNPDVHNFTGWRDALDPSLPDLLSRAWPAT